MDTIKKQIRTDQPFVSKIFKIGKKVTPLKHYIPGTDRWSYRHTFLLNMLDSPYRVIDHINEKEDKISLRDADFYWSPAMFQEFWIYALFQEKYAEQILRTQETGTIDKILYYTFTCHASGMNPFLQRIADGKVINLLDLSSAFSYADTTEGYEFWNTVNESLLSKVCKRPIKVKGKEEEETDAELPLITKDKHSRLIVMDFKMKTPIINR